MFKTIKEYFVFEKMGVKKVLKRAYKKSEKIISEKGLGKYRVLQSGGRILRSQLKSDFVEIDGHKIFLDKIDSSELFTNGKYDEFETSIISKIIKKGDVVVDIGANIGYYSLTFAKLVGKSGKVFAFEPEPTNFNLLKKNIETNGYKNVVLCNKAVSNSEDKISLYLNDINYGGHTIFHSQNDVPKIEIDSIKLDEFFKNNEQEINFIKMDIEGAELEALKGMSSILEKNKDVKIMSEFNPPLHKKFNINPEEFLQTFLRLGFKIFHLDDKTKKIKPIIIEDFLKKHLPQKNYYTNILCTKAPLPDL